LEKVEANKGGKDIGNIIFGLKLHCIADLKMWIQYPR